MLREKLYFGFRPVMEELIFPVVEGLGGQPVFFFLLQEINSAEQLMDFFRLINCICIHIYVITTIFHIHIEIISAATSYG